MITIIAAVLTIWLGIFFYITVLNKKLNKLYKMDYQKLRDLRDLADVPPQKGVLPMDDITNLYGKPVTVIDVKMPFWSMVVFMVKWSIASIPAVIILSLIIIIVLAVAGVGLGGLFSLR